MINRELISDLPRFRRTEAGYFAAPVPVLAEPIAAVKACEPSISAGEARESTHESYSQHQLKDWVADSRGERSISDFAGGVAKRQTQRLPGSDRAAGAPSRGDAGSIPVTVTSKLSGGRWK